MKKVIFQILGTIIRLFYEVFLIFSQPAVYFEKSPSQMKIDEEHLFWGTSHVVLFFFDKKMFLFGNLPIVKMQ